MEDPLNQADDLQVMKTLLRYFEEKRSNNDAESSDEDEDQDSSEDSSSEGQSHDENLSHETRHQVKLDPSDDEDDEDDDKGYDDLIALHLQRGKEPAYSGGAIQVASSTTISSPPRKKMPSPAARPEMDNHSSDGDDSHVGDSSTRHTTSLPSPAENINGASDKEHNKIKSSGKAHMAKKRNKGTNQAPPKKEPVKKINNRLKAPTPKFHKMTTPANSTNVACQQGNPIQPHSQAQSPSQHQQVSQPIPPPPRKKLKNAVAPVIKLAQSAANAQPLSSSSSSQAPRPPPPAAPAAPVISTRTQVPSAAAIVARPKENSAITKVELGLSSPSKREMDGNDSSLKDLEVTSVAVETEAEKEEAELDQAVDKTKTLLEKVITRPKLKIKLLLRPPFGFIHAIISEIVRSQGLGASLFEPHELWSSHDTQEESQAGGGQPVSKADRIRFLVRAISFVAFADPVNSDLQITVVPARVLAGLDPLVTNRFLQALALTCQLPRAALDAAEKRVLETGDIKLYAEAIKMRSCVTKLQAHVRGTLLRRRLSPAPMRTSVSLKDMKMRIVTRTERAIVPESEKDMVLSRKDEVQVKARKQAFVSTSQPKNAEQHRPPQVVAEVPRGKQGQQPQRKDHIRPSRTCSENSQGSIKSDAAMLKEMDDLRKKLEEAEKSLAASAKHKEMVEKAFRARQRAEKQAEALANQKESVEEELKKAKNSQKRLASNFMKAIETNKRMEEKLKKTLVATQHGQSSPSPHHQSSFASDDQDHQLLQAKMRWLEKREFQVRSLECKLKQKEAETVQLKSWESKLMQKEERIQKLADALRQQRDKLKVTQEQAEAQTSDYETRLKTLDRLTSLLEKHQRKAAKASRDFRRARGLCLEKVVRSDKDQDIQSPSINEQSQEMQSVNGPADVHQEESQYDDGGLCQEEKGDEEEGDEQVEHISQIFEEMLQHSQTVVDILPQLTQDNMDETESMAMSDSQAGSVVDYQVNDQQQQGDLESDRGDGQGTVSSSSAMAQRNSCSSSASMGDFSSSSGEDQGEDTKEDMKADNEETISEAEGFMDWDNFKTSVLMNKQRPKIPEVKPSIYRLIHQPNGQPKPIHIPDSAVLPASISPCPAVEPAAGITHASGLDHSSTGALSPVKQRNLSAPSSSSEQGKTLPAGEYEVALARLETFLRKRRLCLDDLMPSRRTERVPGRIALRDFRVILQTVNKASDIYQILCRNQLNVLLKEAPKAIGSNAIDQKGFQVAMRKAFSQLGAQTLVPSLESMESPPPTIMKHRRGGSDPGMPSKKYMPGPAASSGSLQLSSAALNSISDTIDDEVASIKSSGSTFLKRIKAEDVRELEKRHATQEIEGDIKWIDTFDSRFDSSLQKLESLRDQTHIA